MGILHGTAGFQLTPDYDALLASHANLNPDHPDPRFDAEERAQLVFRWPDSDPAPPVKVPRRRNGQFAKKKGS